MTKKKTEPNPIEEAIGERAKDQILDEKLTREERRILNQRKPTTVAEKILQTPAKVAKQILSETLDEPSPSEMLTLEELNRQTEERLQDQYQEEKIDQVITQTERQAMVTHIVPKVPIIPVSKPDPQPATKTSSPESPPQETESDVRSRKAFEITKDIKKTNEQTLQEVNSGIAIEEIDEYQDAEKYELKEEITVRGCSINIPAEDIELTALKKYILEDGFVLATVAFHIVSLCAEPLTTPSTTMWDFRDRAMIPDMVLALLNQPGYLEGIWPSLSIVMSDNKGNAAWCAGIATTIAFFDVIRTLPALKELQNAN